jgi:hypothetical protein
MKKFYAMIAAALMSVSLFAAEPTQADLASYKQADHYVACFSTPADATCNDIVWVGTYNGWNLADEEIIVCEKLAGFDGWYVAVVPVAAEGGENSGKPVQKNECGKLEWAYQCGHYGTIELVAGTVDIVAGGAFDDKNETDLKNWSTTEPTIIRMSAWKGDANPCTKQCDAVDITVRVYAPFCDDNPEFEPSLMGSFNNWTAPAAMEFNGTYFEYVIQGATSTLEFKFNNNSSNKDDWSNQFEYYVPEDVDNDVPESWNTFNNFKLDPNDDMSKFYQREGNILTFDFSDTEKYRYANCGKEPEPDCDTETVHKVTFVLTAPAGAPEAGIELIGDFNGWLNGGEEPIIMELKEDGKYYAEVDVHECDQYKYREPGNWDNQIQKDGGDFQPKVRDVWNEEKNKVEQDLSGAEFAWSASQGIENIVLTEKAQKVMVDGVMYIIRDNKLYNVHGTQVR